ncbi:MAG: bifunctional phosphoribosyl-AMP cyclohydrolase/phosphoribosyl-ATP diphosphatase HisIE, partial [Saprospiraceae bacterium]
MNVDFNKNNGIVPVIIQDDLTLQVLMLGYMNEEAFLQTRQENKVTFFSRSKNRLWTKGETSGNYLFVKNIRIDCDQDTILIKVIPRGPVCHTGATSCFGDDTAKGTLYLLEETISQRIADQNENSYSNKLFHQGIHKI